MRRASCRHYTAYAFPYSRFTVKSLHDVVCGIEDVDDALIVDDVVIGEVAATAVFEPLLRGLVTADVGVPCRGADIGEVLRVVNPYLAMLAVTTIGLELVTLHGVRAAFGEAGGNVPTVGIAHQMQVYELAAQSNKLVEAGLVLRIWHTGEVNLQKLFVLLTILRTVEHGIDITEQVLRLQFLMAHP